MSFTQYRVDRVSKQAHGAYRVPCGMTSIVYLGAKPPSIGLVLKGLAKPLEAHEALIFSKWHTTRNDYVVVQVEAGTDK